MGDTKQVIRLKYVWALWMLFGLFSACKLYIQGVVVGPTISFASALLLGLFDAHVWFLATVPILRLAERFWPGHGNRLARFLLHALACAGFSAVVLAVQDTF